MTKGISLLETVIVVALLAMLTSFSAYISVGEFNRALASSDEARIIETLRSARGESMRDICDSASCRRHSAHGVAFSPGSMTEYEGSDYALRNSDEDVATALAPLNSVSGLEDVSFNEYGAPTDAGSLNLLTDGLPVASIAILATGAFNIETR